MFIDYLTLMLVNMAAGLGVLACYLWAGRSKIWCAGLAVAGALALAGGLHMTFTWPLPGPFNIAFGELSALFGAVMLSAALAIGFGWSLQAVGLYATLPSLVAILVGIRIWGLGLTNSPPMAAVGFTLTGAGGILTSLSFITAGHRGLARLAAVVLILAALLWAFVGSAAYWTHLKSFGDYQPPLMIQATAQPSAATEPAE